MRRPAIAALVFLLLGCCWPASARADQRSQALCREGYEAAYNIDYERAIQLFTQAEAADPNDAASYRAAAAIHWMWVLFLRGSLQVDDYLGHISSSPDVPMPAPPGPLAAAFHQQIDRAIELAEKDVAAHYHDAGSHYSLGAALGLSASYTGSVDGHVFSALRAARRAYSEHSIALDIDPSRRDAGLVVGTYRYLVSTLPAPVRLMAYIVGFGGGKEEGIRLIESAAAQPGEAQADARLALLLIYNREGRFNDALRTVRLLERMYPRNRLLVLEEGSTALRARRPQEAERVLDAGLAALQHDTRVRMPGEEARWRYKRGLARLRLGRLAEAEGDLRAAAAIPDVRDWMLARIHVALGQVDDLRNERRSAKNEYRAALRLLETVKDPDTREEAVRLLNLPYRQ